MAINFHEQAIEALVYFTGNPLNFTVAEQWLETAERDEMLEIFRWLVPETSGRDSFELLNDVFVEAPDEVKQAFIELICCGFEDRDSELATFLDYFAKYTRTTLQATLEKERIYE